MNKGKFHLESTVNNPFLEVIFSHYKTVYFTEKDKADIVKAYNLAVELHQGQERHNKIPYITHIEGSAMLYINETLHETEPCDPTNLVAIILHDCVEDNPKGLQRILESGLHHHIPLNVLFMSKPTQHVRDQVYAIRESYPEVYQLAVDKNLIHVYEWIEENDPHFFMEKFTQDTPLSPEINNNIIEIWNTQYRTQFEQNTGNIAKQKKIYASLMFLCMIAVMPRERFRIKATERRHNLQDVDGLLFPEKITSALGTMLTTMKIYVPRSRDVFDSPLAMALTKDVIAERSCLIQYGLIEE